MSLAATAALAAVRPLALSGPTRGSEWNIMDGLAAEIIIGVVSIPAEYRTT
jgi:hypothetical protein